MTTNQVQQCQLEGDPDWWFDYNEESNQHRGQSEETKMAISICNRCDALNDCRAFALQYSELFGVWGGLTPADRYRIRKKENITPIPFNHTWRRPTQEWIDPV